MLSIKRLFSLFVISLFLGGCASYDYPSQVKLGDTMIEASGESLAGDIVVIPNDFAGQQTLLLFG